MREFDQSGIGIQWGFDQCGAVNGNLTNAARREREEGIRQLMHEAESKLLEAKTLEEKVRGQAQALHLLFGQWHKVPQP